jgi:outer membrane protein assembly factor BamA
MLSSLTPRATSRSCWAVALLLGVASGRQSMATELLGVAATAGGRPDLVAAKSTTTAWPDDATLEARGVRIGAIAIRVRDVFDATQPGENRRFFRAANRLHIDTRERVIARQLLFRSGDRFDRRVLDETERLLRADRYLYDATIEVAAMQGNTVDLVVTTRDVWTLNLVAGVGRSGGVNTSHFEVKEDNLFGTGKGLLLSREVGIDRTATELRYDDSNLFGSRARLSASYRDNSDGYQRELRLERPFFSLDSRWAVGGLAVDEERVDALYQLGEISSQFRHRQRQLELSAGLSRGLVAGWTSRLSLGVTYRQDRFEPFLPSPPAAALPGERTFAYPWLSLDRVQDRFVEERDLDQIHRTEDLQLGRKFHLRAGLASAATGSERTVAIFDGSASLGYRPSPRQTLTLETRGSGRWGSAGAENLLLSAAGRYYLRDFGDQLFFANLEVAAADTLDAENQLLLGGDNGLRGYPLRYQDGDRRLLLTLEQRFFTRFQLFQLLHIGGALFYDVGRTWGSDRRFGKNFGWLQDVGVGLRLASSRSHSGSVLHLDLAFPLSGGQGIQSMQYLATTKARF